MGTQEQKALDALLQRSQCAHSPLYGNQQKSHRVVSTQSQQPPHTYIPHSNHHHYNPWIPSMIEKQVTGVHSTLPYFSSIQLCLFNSTHPVIANPCIQTRQSSLLLFNVSNHNSMQWSQPPIQTIPISILPLPSNPFLSITNRPNPSTLKSKRECVCNRKTHHPPETRHANGAATRNEKIPFPSENRGESWVPPSVSIFPLSAWTLFLPLWLCHY